MDPAATGTAEADTVETNTVEADTVEVDSVDTVGTGSVETEAIDPIIPAMDIQILDLYPAAEPVIIITTDTDQTITPRTIKEVPTLAMDMEVAIRVIIQADMEELETILLQTI